MTELSSKRAHTTYEYYDKRTDSVKKLRLLGHSMLVRRCLRDEGGFLVGELPPGVKLNREAELMVRSFQEATPTQWAAVKSLGPKCGTPMSHDEWERYRLPDNHKGACNLGRGGRKYSVPRGIVNPCRLDDRVLLPPASMNGTMFRGVLRGAEADDSEQSYLIISEFDMIAVCPRENADE